MPAFPGKIMDLADKLNDGRYTFEWNQEELKKLRQEIAEGNRRNVFSIVGAVLLTGCFILVGAYLEPQTLASLRLLAPALGLAGICLLYFSLRR
jgi:hypothetical protein